MAVTKIIRGRNIQECTLSDVDGTAPRNIRKFVQEIQITRSYETSDETSLGDEEMSTGVLKGKSDITLKMLPVAEWAINSDGLVSNDNPPNYLFFPRGDSADGDDLTNVLAGADDDVSRKLVFEAKSRGTARNVPAQGTGTGWRFEQEVVLTSSAMSMTSNGDASYDLTFTSYGGSPPKITKVISGATG